MHFRLKTKTKTKSKIAAKINTDPHTHITTHTTHIHTPNPHFTTHTTHIHTHHTHPHTHTHIQQQPTICMDGQWLADLQCKPKPAGMSNLSDTPPGKIKGSGRSNR